MALVDFYQLAILRELSRADPGFPSIRSHRLCMPDTSPPYSPTPSVEPDDVRSSLPPSIQPQLKTPEHEPSATCPMQDTTPLSRGSSIRQRQEGDTDRVEGYDREDHEEYVHEDLKSRVFVDYEVFMKSVLHVPKDWNTQWKSVIRAVEADPEFQKHCKEYFECCDCSATREELFYRPLAKMTNTVLDIWSEFGGSDSGIPQAYHVNRPRKLQGGIFNKANLSPNLVVVHKDCSTKSNNLHWANALRILEVKPYGNVICDGCDMPNLVVDGINPGDNHARPNDRLCGKVTALSGSNLGSSSSRKQAADGPSIASQQPSKKSKMTSTLGQTEESEGRSTPKPEIQRKLEPANQVCRYLLEMFSVPLLRSHATVSLVDRHRLQLYHANRSVILVSSAINFSGGDGLEKFIATIIAFRRFSHEQNGIFDTLVPKDASLVQDSNFAVENKVVQKGSVLVFAGNGSDENFEVKLGETISRDPAVVGRSTAVVGATSVKWPGHELVIKVSWPGSGQVPETDFLEKACAEANKMKDNEWAIDHLPQVLHSKDVVFGRCSTLESVAHLFEDAKFTGRRFRYERRTLRVIIQERLYSIKTLMNVRDIGQVFLDVACIHRWLFDEPGILHRDLSLNNIMCRIVKELGAKDKVYGVLTDYDLSSWAASLNNDCTETSQQQTGTPPYMAQELLRGTSDIHLYRHDIESLFYIMLLTCAHHTFDHSNEARWSVIMREGALPYRKWFNEQDYNTLGNHKIAFFSEMEPIILSPVFEDFRGWLLRLRRSFSYGFTAKQYHDQQRKALLEEQVEETCYESLPSPFDDETLGGHVSYSAVIELTRHLKGELKELAIRYKPSSPAPG